MLTNTPLAEPKQNSSSTKKEFLLFLSIPVAIILIVASIVLVPSLFAKPKFNFVYSYCPDYFCGQGYAIDKSGTVTMKEGLSTLNLSYYNKQPDLYLHDMSTGASKKISLADANNLRLNSSNVSPDGYVLKQNSSSSGSFLFAIESSDDSWYLENGLKKKKVNLTGTSNSYRGNINFLGWVE